MLQQIILRIQDKLTRKLMATLIFFGLAAWVAARFVGEDSFLAVLFTVVAALMLTCILLFVFVAPMIDKRKP